MSRESVRGWTGGRVTLNLLTAERKRGTAFGSERDSEGTFVHQISGECGSTRHAYDFACRTFPCIHFLCGLEIQSGISV